MASAQEVEMLRRQLDELTAQMIEIRQQSSSTAMNAAVTGLTEAVRTMGQSVSKPRPEDMRVWKPEPYAPGKDFDDWDFTFNGYAGTLDPAYPALLKTARQSPTMVMATPPHEQQSATLLYLLTMLTQKGARKVVRKAGNNGFEAYRQLCLMYGTYDQEGSTGLFVQIMTYKFGSMIEDLEDRLNEFLELVRRYGGANGTDPVPDQVKKACIISNTPEPLKTRLQLNVAELGNFNALRVATEDYLRSRRIFKTTSAGNTHGEVSMEVDAVSRKGKGKEKSGKGKKGGKKGKESHPGKGYGETTTEHSRFEGECRNCGKYGHKAADCWYKQQQHKPQGKGKGTGKSKSKVTEISESDSSKQVDETWTPNTSAQQPNLSQVNTIGCADEGLWIFSLEDSKKRRYTVNWEDQSCNKTEEHELMIDSGCFGHVCPPWFAPQFPMVSSTNVEAVAANNVALQHYGQKVVYGHVMTNTGRLMLIQITLDVMNVRKPLLSTSALKHRGVTIIFNHDYDRIIFRNETVNLVSHDCHSYLHITLTNGIPPRKAMVMAGESAANDVDEEVYGNDGGERHEAQEASPMRIKPDSLTFLMMRKL